MSEIRVSFGALQQGVDQLRAARGQLEAEFADLKSYLAPMVATWDGQASATYHAEQQRIDGSLQHMSDTLNTTQLKLQAAEQDFQSTESLNAGRFGGA